MISSTTMNMPSNPVQTLPLSSTTTANGSVNTSATASVLCSITQPPSCRIGRENINGCRPSISSPATAVAAKTASTELRPSSSQYTSDRCRISAYSSSTSAAPMPKSVADSVNSGSCPLTARVTRLSPDSITSTTPNVTW